jgi:type VI secretion system protein VasJ
LEAILVDIAKDNPVGIDLKYDDTFLEIEQEIDKDYSLNEESTNWEIVQDNCYDFLKVRSKDFKIAVWWIFSNWNQNNWDGLQHSLIVFNQFIEKYHQDFFPKSIKARQNALMWLETVLNNAIVEQKQHANKVEHSAEIIELLKQTQDLTKELLKIEENYFGKIIRYLRSLSPQVESAPEVVEKKTKQKIKKVEKSEESITSISSEDDAKKVFQNLKKSASMLSEYYRKENPFDLKALRITRFLSWIGIDDLPVKKDGVTFINPPSEMTMMKFNEYLENNEKEEAFTFLQSILERSPYWLDGHYRSVEMLEEFEKTQEAQEVKNALIAFVKSHEGIEQLSFKDGTPFLSNPLPIETSSIEVETLPTNQEKDFTQKVKQIIKNHQEKEAIKLLQNEYETVLSYEEKFKLRLEVVKESSIKKHPNVLLALLEGLEKDVDKYHLEEWNPDLALEVYMLLIKHFDGQKDKKEKFDKAYDRLSKINIAQALNLK